MPPRVPALPTTLSVTIVLVGAVVDVDAVVAVARVGGAGVAREVGADVVADDLVADGRRVVHDLDAVDAVAGHHVALQRTGAADDVERRALVDVDAVGAVVARGARAVGREADDVVADDVGARVLAVDVDAAALVARDDVAAGERLLADAVVVRAAVDQQAAVLGFDEVRRDVASRPDRCR